MENNLLHEELIFLNYEANDREELLRRLSSELEKGGYVKESYVEGILDREKVFPTGLNTEGIKVALPHTDAIHVNKPAIAIAKLKNPVTFREMGGGEKEVEAKLIFMMAVKNPDEQIILLSRLMSILSDKEMLINLYNCTTNLEVIDMLTDVLYGKYKII